MMCVTMPLGKEGKGEFCAGRPAKAGKVGVDLVAMKYLYGILAIFLMVLIVAPSGELVPQAGAAGRVINISGGQRVGKLTVSIGKSETIRVSEAFENVVVGDPETADVAPLTDQTLYVLGRKLGTTNISLYNDAKQLIAVVDIEVAHDKGGLEQAIRRAVPAANVKVRTINGRVLLEGTAPDAVALDRVLQIAEDFAPKNVTNAMSVGANQQVMLEVRFLEATRSNGRDLGVQWQAVAKNFSVATSSLAGGAFASGLSGGAAPFGTVIANLLGGGGTQADVVIEALEGKGLVRRLAEPNLVALSGESASFLAGGEFPIPVARDVDGDGDNVTATVTVAFKKFGVGLAFTPTVLGNGLINLVIEPEVSELDFSQVVVANGLTIPSFNVRRAKTTIELRDGQSFALAGLLSSTNRRSASQVPWISDVPVLGALFRSTNFQKSETDLVIIVTPRLVRPQAPNRPLKSPLDNTLSSNDKELFLYGKLEVTKELAHFIETGGNLEGPFGHIIDLPGGSNNAVTK